MAADTNPDPIFGPAREVRVYGQRIRYVERGSGPATILLHGLNSAYEDWRPNFAALSQGRRVIALDQLGDGGSDKPLSNYRIGTWTAFLTGFMDALRIERASLVGLSLGGAVAASMGIEHPERVERLVIVNAGYGFALPQTSDPARLGHVPGTLQLLNPGTPEETRREIALVTVDRSRLTDEAFVRRFYERTLSHAFTNQRFLESFLRREDVLDGRLGAIRAPTLVVGGRQDGIVPHALNERFAREIPGARLVVCDACGHGLPGERTDEFNRVTAEFLDARPGAATPAASFSAAGGQ